MSETFVIDEYLGRLSRETAPADLPLVAAYVQDLLLATALFDLWDRAEIALYVEDGKVRYRRNMAPPDWGDELPWEDAATVGAGEVV